MQEQLLNLLPQKYHASIKKNKMWNNLEELTEDYDKLFYLCEFQKAPELSKKWGNISPLILEYIRETSSDRAWNILENL